MFSFPKYHYDNAKTQAWLNPCVLSWNFCGENMPFMASCAGNKIHNYPMVAYCGTLCILVPMFHIKVQIINLAV